MASHQIACIGGVYSNYLALEQTLRWTKQQGIDEVFCLGDLGAFGPFPDRVFPLLIDYHVRVVQGNYDNSVGNQLNDCQCGYVDPRDNYFAQISYDYTLQKTSSENRRWLAELPQEIRLQRAGHNILLVHGSSRKQNEFLWESTTSTSFLDYLLDQVQTEVMVATHTGIKWQRQLQNNKLFVNCGAIGRPENDGKAHVWIAVLKLQSQQPPEVEFQPIHYDHQRLAREMRSEKLPEEFAETILTGWWTTCLEILPAKERRRGKH